MNIFFRCDSSSIIGTGHVVRTLNLAIALKDRNHSITFICKNLLGNISELIISQGFDVINLEERETEDYLKRHTPQWMIVDHYDLGEDWEKMVRALGIKLFVIDDIFRKHSCDVLLDQNFHLEHRDKVESCLEYQTKRFLGPEFAILSKFFLDLVPSKKRPNESCSKVVVFFGGIDNNGETLKLLQNQKLKSSKLFFSIIIGNKNPARDKISALAEDIKNVNLKVQIHNMAEVLSDTDLFIGAGGTTTWERCYYGIPSVCVATAKNQIDVAKDLAEAEIHQFLGTSNILSADDYLVAIENLANDYNRRVLYSNNSYDLKVAKKFNQLLDIFE